MRPFSAGHWALVLGGSSGFGLAAAKKLSRHGMSICVVHRDRRGAMTRIESEFDQIRAHGHGFHSCNVDALSDPGRERVLADLSERLGEHGRVRVLLHSIAAGNVRPAAPPTLSHEGGQGNAVELLSKELAIPADALRAAVEKACAQGGDALAGLLPRPADARPLMEEDMAQTIHAMGSSLLTWVSALHKKGLFAADARVLALTSEGNQRAWPNYGAVAAAKAVLESLCRTIAVEFAGHGIRANAIQAGVTSTAALRAIPGHELLEANARMRNPFGRLTQAQDVADFICLLCTDEAAWVNGSVLRVDGGEAIAG